MNKTVERIMRQRCRQEGHRDRDGRCSRCGDWIDVNAMIDHIIQKNLHILTRP